MAASRINRDTMFEPLLEADPSFRPLWAEFLADWGDEPDPPLYLALGSLAEHVLDRLEAGNTERFDAIFAVVERWHTDGDAYVTEAATVGLLETLQNLSSKYEGKAAAIEQWFGAQTKDRWERLDRFWEGDPRALCSDGK